MQLSWHTDGVPFQVMSKRSFLVKKPTWGALSTARTFRLSSNPYSGLSRLSESGANLPPRKGSFMTHTSFLRPSSAVLGPQDMSERETQKHKEYMGMLENLSLAQREELRTVQEEIGWCKNKSANDYEWIQPWDKDHFEQSHESDWSSEDEHNGESEDEDHLALPRVVGAPIYTRNWAERLANEQQSWERQIPLLCDAFLAYRRTGLRASVPADSCSASAQVSFELDSLLLTERKKLTFTPGSPAEPVNVTLMRQGFLSPTPNIPKLAIHVDVLRFSVALRWHASALSVQAIAASLSELYNVPYMRHLRTQLSNTIDVYLAILRMIDSRVNRTLNRDECDWQLRNSCAACTYRLDDEPDLKYSMLITLDGNDSLKRVATSAIFENEVKAKAAKKEKAKIMKVGSAPGTREQTAQDGSSTEEPNVPTSETTIHGPTLCEERWKNAKADENARPIVVFDETGVFAACCRHGTALLLADMKRSGELAKYGLAMVDKLGNVFGGKLLIGYDIGCTFNKTVSRSPLVGPIAQKLGLSFCVGAFHGYSHNRACQLSYHPLYVEGAGSENFEGCERLFSSTNATAITTRHASAFHRRQHISLHLTGWNTTKRCNLGSVLKSKYVATLKVIENAPRIIQGLNPHGTEEMWHLYVQAERDYYGALEHPPPDNAFSILYIKRLRVLLEKEKAFNEVFSTEYAYVLPGMIEKFRHHPKVQGTATEDTYQDVIARNTRQLESKRTAATEQLLAIQTEVSQLELEYEISPRWTPGCSEWIAAEKLEALSDFHAALDSLERGTIQRLMELKKANVSGTGYKLRVFIAKALKRREKALHNALRNYNALACKMEPPRPTLTFKELIEGAYISNFDFLRQSQHGIQAAEWAKPVNLQCTREWQSLKRAQEEIARLNVEIRRVVTHIQDEEDFLIKKAQSLEQLDPNLAHEIRTRSEHTIQVNQIITRDIRAISKLKGFSGNLTCGKRPISATSPKTMGGAASDSHHSVGISPLSPAEVNTEVESEEETVMELPDDTRTELSNLEQSCHVQ
ncbi:hypothetical protein CTheo_8328 [Ceratobasidium theobromae]|uniref:CxC1-like cysteine cluster associated with KDZ transposases domain-containing protein n=1 Tax=Ceratobasidium theobromae TaxID=1582974 RepID=A0A5N5Q8Z6_9AGAM|nr:hypothetical protein CTheo_8328 [Ceratobasidium theobromae]